MKQIVAIGARCPLSIGMLLCLSTYQGEAPRSSWKNSMRLSATAASTRGWGRSTYDENGSHGGWAR